MGHAVLRLAALDAGCEVVAAVSRTPVPGLDGVHALAASELASAPAFDVAVDFSLPAGFDPLLALCLARGSGLVSGTTGLDPGQRSALESAGRSIPVLWSANFSLGVAVLARLARQAAAALPGWDCDIIESHHVRKLDAPSGTALALGEAVAVGRGGPPHYVSVRAGDIVGEHTVQLTGLGERLELVHRATDRDVFARGALAAASWLGSRTPGVYSIDDCLGPALPAQT